MSDVVIRMTCEDDENIEIYVDETYVGSANHDEHGWAGMGAVEDLARNIAAALDIKFEDER